MRRFILGMCLVFAGGVASAAVEIQTITTPAGIDAWVVEERSLPFIAMEVRMQGGGNLDRPGKRGSVNLMMALLEEGSADMDARTFQEARESLAASFEFNAYDDTVTVSTRFLTEKSDEAITLLRQALVEPRFDEDAIEWVRAQVLAGIEADAKNPSRIAGDAFYAAAFPDHPYGSDMDGTPETVASLTREDLVQAHRDTVTRAEIHVSVVGDVNTDEAARLVDMLLADLPADAPEPPGHVEFGLEGGVTVVDFPTPQSVALFGHDGIERDHPDFFAAYILNHILGGGSFESRLMNEVREKRGLTYGISTFLVPRERTEMVLGQVASSNDRIADAIEVIRDEWARMAREGVTSEELDAAKTFITGEYPLRFDGNGPIADIMVGMQQVGLSPDYVINRNDFIEAVTLEEINRVASELLDADALHFVIVGQPEGLETD
jgi:zinc protease